MSTPMTKRAWSNSRDSAPGAIRWGLRRPVRRRQAALFVALCPIAPWQQYPQLLRRQCGEESAPAFFRPQLVVPAGRMQCHHVRGSRHLGGVNHLHAVARFPCNPIAERSGAELAVTRDRVLCPWHRMTLLIGQRGERFARAAPCVTMAHAFGLQRYPRALQQALQVDD